METKQPDALASAQTEALLLPAAASKESLRRGRHSAFLEGGRAALEAHGLKEAK
jgi:hypothetical protein